MASATPLRRSYVFVHRREPAGCAVVVGRDDTVRAWDVPSLPRGSHLTKGGPDCATGRPSPAGPTTPLTPPAARTSGAGNLQLGWVGPAPLYSRSRADCQNCMCRCDRLQGIWWYTSQTLTPMIPMRV